MCQSLFIRWNVSHRHALAIQGKGYYRCEPVQSDCGPLAKDKARRSTAVELRCDASPAPDTSRSCTVAALRLPLLRDGVDWTFR